MRTWLLLQNCASLSMPKASFQAGLDDLLSSILFIWGLFVYMNLHLFVNWPFELKKFAFI